MKTLRKDSGGYALLYVLIIVVVLCAIAAAIYTVALRNYQEQARAVAQTRQLYQAEGEIEKFVALAEDVSGRLSDSGMYTAEDDAKKMARTIYVNYVKSLSNGYTLLFDDEKPCEFTLTYKNEAVCIESTISMSLDYLVIPGTITKADGTETPAYSAKVNSAAHTYLTYTITHLTAERGEGHETE